MNLLSKPPLGRAVHLLSTMAGSQIQKERLKVVKCAEDIVENLVQSMREPKMWLDQKRPRYLRNRICHPPIQGAADVTVTDRQYRNVNTSTFRIMAQQARQLIKLTATQTGITSIALPLIS
jgi:hypothetical protein